VLKNAIIDHIFLRLACFASYIAAITFLLFVSSLADCLVTSLRHKIHLEQIEKLIAQRNTTSATRPF
jgi:hypothetical protein